MAARPKAQPIVRQIYFYQMSDLLDLWRGTSTPKFSPPLLANDLKALPDDARYFRADDEYDLCLLSDSDYTYQFGKARRTDTATVVANGRVKPLRLNQGEKLFDRIHLVFFPEGFVGAEFNLVGPKMPALTEYLDSKLTSCAPVTFDRLINDNPMERLSRVREIRLIEMRIDTARSDVLAPFSEGWIDTSRAMREQLGVGSIDVTLRAGTTSHRPLRENVISAVRDAFSAPNLRDAADKFKVKVIPEGQNVTVTIDLLEDKLMTSVEIRRDIYRNPDLYKDFIYDKIRSTYAALKQDIMQAARIIS